MCQYFFKVGLQLLTGDSSNGELYLDVDDLSLTWNTPSGDVVDTSPLGVVGGRNLSDWFSLVKDETSGSIARVFFPQGESEAMVAFKKSLSQLISIGEVDEREVLPGGTHVVRGEVELSQRQATVQTDKV